MTTEMVNCSAGVKEHGTDRKILTIRPFDVIGLMQRGFNSVIIDVRAKSDFIRGHVPKAVNLPEGNWDKISGWHNEYLMIIYSYAQDCPLGHHAAQKFATYNYAVIAMEGGFEAWKKNDLPVEG